MPYAAAGIVNRAQTARNVATAAGPRACRTSPVRPPMSEATAPSGEMAKAMIAPTVARFAPWLRIMSAGNHVMSPMPNMPMIVEPAITCSAGLVDQTIRRACASGGAAIVGHPASKIAAARGRYAIAAMPAASREGRPPGIRRASRTTSRRLQQPRNRQSCPGSCPCNTRPARSRVAWRATGPRLSRRWSAYAPDSAAATPTRARSSVQNPVANAAIAVSPLQTVTSTVSRRTRLTRSTSMPSGIPASANGIA